MFKIQNALARHVEPRYEGGWKRGSIFLIDQRMRSKGLTAVAFARLFQSNKRVCCPVWTTITTAKEIIKKDFEIIKP